MDAPSAPKFKSTSQPDFSERSLRTRTCRHAEKPAASSDKPPRQLRRTSDADSRAGQDFWSIRRKVKRASLFRKKVSAVKTAVHPKSSSEFTRTRTKPFEPLRIAAEDHFRDAFLGFQGSNQNKAILTPAPHQKIQQPVHPVVQIHVSSTRRHF